MVSCTMHFYSGDFWIGYFMCKGDVYFSPRTTDIHCISSYCGIGSLSVSITCALLLKVAYSTVTFESGRQCEGYLLYSALAVGYVRSCGCLAEEAVHPCLFPRLRFALHTPSQRRRAYSLLQSGARDVNAGAIPWLRRKNGEKIAR